MEFLMTYGWAILVVLAAIGALAYFGVLSPDRFLPDKCTANPPFSCTQYKVLGGTTTTVNLTISNNAGSDLQNVIVGFTCNDGAIPGTLVAVTGNTSGVLNGNQGTWSFTCGTTGAANVGQRFKGNYTITYIKAGETVDHKSGGTLQVRAE